MKYLIDEDMITHEITPEVVAELFADMDSRSQAKFFNSVSEIASAWNGGGLPFQLQAITEEDGLTLQGRNVMSMIGEYSHWGLVCSISKDVKNENY